MSDAMSGGKVLKRDPCHTIPSPCKGKRVFRR
jgi:hypothetical protein